MASLGHNELTLHLCIDAYICMLSHWLNHDQIQSLSTLKMPTANLNTSVHSRTRKYTQTIMKFMHACIDACTCMDTHTHSRTYIHICLLLIPMVWNRQANFESKGDKLFSSAECRIRTQGLRHQIANRLNARWQTDWAIEDQAKKNLNSTVHPYDQRAFSPLHPTAGCL